MTFQRRLRRIPRDRQNAPALDEIGVVVKRTMFFNLLFDLLQAFFY